MSLSLFDHLEHLDANALRALLLEREQQLARAFSRQAHHEQVLAEKDVLIRGGKERDLHLKETTIANLTHEIAVLRRNRFGTTSEQVSGVQGRLRTVR